MTDEQIRLLLSLGSDEARLLLENGEYALYRRIQRKMVKLVREYDVKLPLSCLRFSTASTVVAGTIRRFINKTM